DLAGEGRTGKSKIACLALSRIANFEDLDPLKLDPEIDLVMVRPGAAIPGDAVLVIIPGTKSTRGDLDFLRAQGWDIDILAHHRRGGNVLGICGGYQMLGSIIADPMGMEGENGETPGLGLLNVTTQMSADKRLARVTARHAATGLLVDGYEIHIGRTEGADCARPFAYVGEAAEGAVSADSRVMGSYLHGLFSSDDFRRAFLSQLGIPASRLSYDQTVDDALNALADHCERHIDVEGLLALAR
ncbi:MAG: cobyric acid synthase CobQ, partial [Hyphomicrobium sp.]